MISPWTQVDPTKPHVLYMSFEESDSYSQWPSIRSIFPLSQSGILTRHDYFVVSMDSTTLVRRFHVFLDSSLSDEVVRSKLGLVKLSRWDMSRARSSLMEASREKALEDFLVPVQVRPFDKRHLFWHFSVLMYRHWPVTQHILGRSNFVLLTIRQMQESWQHAFLSRVVALDTVLSNRSKETTKTLPLYRYI